MQQRDNTPTSTPSSSIQVVVVSFRPYEKNTLQGFVTLALTPPGIVVHDCSYHQRDGKSWVAWPARSYEKEGQTQWCRIVEAADKSAYWRLQSLCVKAVERYLEGRGSTRPDQKAGDGAGF